MHVRFERSRLVQWLVLGPFEWVQLTYDELRIPPNGDPIAGFSWSSDGWWLDRDSGLVRLHVSDDDLGHPFSDVVIYTDPPT